VFPHAQSMPVSSPCWHACLSLGPRLDWKPARPFHLAYRSRPDSIERAVCRGRRARRRPLEGGRGSQAEHSAHCHRHATCVFGASLGAGPAGLNQRRPGRPCWPGLSDVPEEKDCTLSPPRRLMAASCTPLPLPPPPDGEAGAPAE